MDVLSSVLYTHTYCTCSPSTSLSLKLHACIHTYIHSFRQARAYTHTHAHTRSTHAHTYIGTSRCKPNDWRKWTTSSTVHTEGCLWQYMSSVRGTVGACIMRWGTTFAQRERERETKRNKEVKEGMECLCYDVKWYCTVLLLFLFLVIKAEAGWYITGFIMWLALLLDLLTRSLTHSLTYSLTQSRTQRIVLVPLLEKSVYNHTHVHILEMHTHIHTHTHTYTNTCTHICTHTYHAHNTHTHAHTYKYLYGHTDTHVIHPRTYIHTHNNIYPSWAGCVWIIYTIVAGHETPPPRWLAGYCNSYFKLHLA